MKSRRNLSSWIHRAGFLRSQLRKDARKSGDPFRKSLYYERAERFIEELWDSLIWPRIRHCDFERVVDLAAGHGRNSARLQAEAAELILVDINDECLAACRARFEPDPRFQYLLTDGHSLTAIGDRSVTLVYSFDSMVHFEPTVVAAYLREIHRVLKPDAQAFLHHSNYSQEPEGGFREAPHWRNYMPFALFSRYADEAGLEIVRSDAIGWGEEEHRNPDLDRLTLLRRPRGA